MPKIKMLPLVLGHLFFGLGIFYIGYAVKNKVEMLIGILVPAIALVLLFFPQIIFDMSNAGMCSVAEELNDSFFLYSDECTAYLLAKAAMPLLGILSWVYIIIRLIWIGKKKSVEISAT